MKRQKEYPSWADIVEKLTGQKYYEPDKPIPPPRLTRNQVGDRDIRLV